MRDPKIKQWEDYFRKRILNGINEIDLFIDQLAREDIFNHQKFRKLRSRFGSQADWADAVGVSQATVGNYERSATYPNKGTRAQILVAAREFRRLEALKLEALVGTAHEVDQAAAKRALDNSILNAALTDFEFDNDIQRVVPVPFDDRVHVDMEHIAGERALLLESLSRQAKSIHTSMSQQANTNTARLAETLEEYASQCSAAVPNARILYRNGTNINRALSNDEVAWGIREFDRLALDGFIDDHNELMRLFYREALVKLQQVEASPIDESADLPTGADFYDVAKLIASANEEGEGEIFDPAIATLLRDIAREIEETESSEALSADPERKKILKRRRIEAIKNGSVLIGRFLVFTSFFVAFDPVVSVGVAGSIASIVGLVEQQSPGTVRSYYERLRTALPFLPRFPSRR